MNPGYLVGIFESTVLWRELCFIGNCRFHATNSAQPSTDSLSKYATGPMREISVAFQKCVFTTFDKCDLDEPAYSALPPI
jgi:hypothetical protein